MRATASELLQRLPGAIAATWPTGERFARALAHGSMSVELYAPSEIDPQTPHAQDELYFIHAGTGSLVVADVTHSFAAGDCFFVSARVTHRFIDFSKDFSTWVVFWGMDGGETGTFKTSTSEN